MRKSVLSILTSPKAQRWKIEASSFVDDQMKSKKIGTVIDVCSW